MRLRTMGRRNGGLQLTLRRRLESCKSKYSTAEEIVNHLRSTYPDYHRTKYQTLIRFVHDALRSTNNENDHDDDDDIDDESQKMEEALHLRRRRRKSMGVPSTSSDSASESSGGDGAVSEESAFDLMKTMLRNSYTGTKAVVPTAEEEKNVELEMGGNTSKAATSIANVDGGEAKSSVSNGGGGGDGLKVKRKKDARFKDFGGIKKILEDLKKDLMLLYHPELPRYLGVRPITGILMHGPPGCGKTRLAHAIANETGFSFHAISSTEVVSGVSGESEAKIRELFSTAKMTAPSVVFIDEIDAIASKRENLQREMEKRIVTQLITCMDEPDDSGSSDDDDGPPGYVLVIGATNRLDAIDPALRRPGRFDREIFLPIPDQSAREDILFVLARNRKLDASIDLRKIARSTPGFVGADLDALVQEAGSLAINRTKRELSQDLMSEPTEDWWKEDWLPEERNKLAIKMSDFEEAAEMVQPSSRTKGFSLIPNVKWEDVGALDLLREEFDDYIIRPIKYPEDYEELGMDFEMGFLLYGPPGCGKTLIAKAVANEAGANFIHIKGPELLNKYVGESELAVRTLFSNARTYAPCIIFFDEVDALTTERGKEGGRVIEGVLNQLLIELDGGEQRRGVFVIGATNRPEVMDRALLRPGRFGKHLYVPLPSPDDRVLILKALARKKPVDASVDLSAIGRMKACENLSGADLASLMKEAGNAAIKEKSTSTKTTGDGLTIKTSHFEVALSKVSPSVSGKRRRYYQRLSERLKAA